MRPDERLAIVQEIMIDFAERTGLAPAAKEPRRYLWTDAFAVCTFLELHQQTKNEKFQDLALLLVDQVHNVLGRHRGDDPRSGWISGLDELEGKAHPTKRGLRIGKKLRERGPRERFDERLEWDRDGQYYHYLTKWMHALAQVSACTGNPAYSGWAVELAQAAHAGFTSAPSSGGRKRMHWKMSIDLSYPLVPSMGHHDPLDGYITYSEVHANSLRFSQGTPELTAEIADMVRICEGMEWATDDPLGIGGLLVDAYRVAQMMVRGAFANRRMLTTILAASRSGLNAYARTNALHTPANYRLAFRELGLSIGMHAVERLHKLIETSPENFDGKEQIISQTAALMEHLPQAEIIEGFWLAPGNRKVPSWMEHSDINMVMLATSLAPDGYLTLFGNGTGS